MGNYSDAPPFNACRPLQSRSKFRECLLGELNTVGIELGRNTNDRAQTVPCHRLGPSKVSGLNIGKDCIGLSYSPEFEAKQQEEKSPHLVWLLKPRHPSANRSITLFLRRFSTLRKFLEQIGGNSARHAEHRCVEHVHCATAKTNEATTKTNAGYEVASPRRFRKAPSPRAHAR